MQPQLFYCQFLFKHVSLEVRDVPLLEVSAVFVGGPASESYLGLAFVAEKGIADPSRLLQGILGRG